MNNFTDRCYALLKLVPKGKVTTYKEIAKALDSKAYRAVGQAMAKNKKIIKIPCHRVVKSNGEVGKYALGEPKKILLLKEEGLTVEKGKIKDFANKLFRF